MSIVRRGYTISAGTQRLIAAENRQFGVYIDASGLAVAEFIIAIGVCPVAVCGWIMLCTPLDALAEEPIRQDRPMSKPSGAGNRASVGHRVDFRALDPVDFNARNLLSLMADIARHSRTRSELANPKTSSRP